MESKTAIYLQLIGESHKQESQQYKVAIQRLQLEVQKLKVDCLKELEKQKQIAAVEQQKLEKLLYKTHTELVSSRKDLGKIRSEVAVNTDQLRNAGSNPLECRVCADRLVDTVMIPCGHVICGSCLKSLSKHSIHGSNKCSFCRSNVVKTNKIYFN
jgi:hypothetical protein